MQTVGASRVETMPVPFERNARHSKPMCSQFAKSCMSVFINGCLLLVVVAFAIQSGASEAREMVCGGRKISLSCEGVVNLITKSCDLPALLFGGEASTIVKRAAGSGRHRNKYVRRADCIVGDDGRFAVLVHFSEGPVDCGPCVILDLYDLDGKRLTEFGKGLDGAISDRRLELLGNKFIEFN